VTINGHLLESETMKITTLIPTSLNDGTPVPASRIVGISTEFANEFGGCTTSPGHSGMWVESGTVYSDNLIKMDIVCDREDLERIREMVIEIGHELQQLAMYFEVRDYDGVQILNMS